MKVAIFGAGGQLGYQLAHDLGAAAIPLLRQDADIRDRQEVRQAIAAHKPDVIINAAAYTDVDRAETERDDCFRVNVEGTRHLVEAAGDAGSTLVQISSDFVFGGDDSRVAAFRENDSPDPISVYGHSKLAAEVVVADYERHFIVRTCGLYVARRIPPVKNFCGTMLRLAESRESVNVVDDQHVTPSYVPHISKAVMLLLGTAAFGKYHIVNAGATTWFDFCKELFRQADVGIPVHPVSSAAYATAAKRPHFSVLDCSKFTTLTGHQLPPWQQGIRDYLCERRKSVQ